MRAALVALAVLAATPATAGAQFGQVEPLTLRGDDDCVRTTGAPGELALPAADGVRFAQAGRTGVQLGRTVAMGKGFECSAVATRASGAGVIAGEINDSVVVSVRAVGADWGAPVTIAVERTWRADSVAAAVSDRGDVIVAWREESTRVEAGRASYRFRAARAAPGAAFGATETLGAESPLHEAVLPAIASTGEAFVLTSTAEGTGLGLRAQFSVYTGTPGAPFGAPAPLGAGQWLSAPAIAAAPDGRALVAFSDSTSQRVAERAPGGAFAPAVRIGDARDLSVTATLLSVGARGEAVVAWARYARGDVQFATRVAAGPFGAPSAISSPFLPEGFDPFYASRAFFAYIIDGAGGLSYEPAYSDLVLTGDGRAALAWFEGGSMTVPSLLTTSLNGGAVTRAPGGRGIEAPQTLRALTLADGTPALAWTETGPGSSYTLHLAAEGVVERADPAPPRVTIGAPRSRTLSEDEALRLPVRCDGPCEVGVATDSLTSGTSDTVRLKRAGSGVLRLRGAAFLAPARVGPVRLTLTYRAPGAKHARTRTVTVRIARAADVPFPRATDVRAVRTGGSIRVTWRITGRQSELESYFVSGTRTRSTAAEPSVLRGVQSSSSRRAYSVSLRAGSEVRFVTVRTSFGLSPRSRVVVPVR